MNFSKTKWHESITVVALTLAIVTLPFSVTMCHAGLLLLTANWIIEGQWQTKWIRMKKNPVLWLFAFFLFLHVAGLLYSEDGRNGIFNLEKKIFFFLLPFVVATITIDFSHFLFLLKSFIATCIVACAICLGVAFHHVSVPPDQPPANFDFANSEEFKLMNPDASITWSYFSYNELSSGINIHPTYLSLYILFSIILLVFFYKKEEPILLPWQKTGIVLLFLFFSIFILMLSVRIITIGYLLFCIAASWWIFFDSGKHSLAVTGVFIVFLFVVASIALNPITRYRSLQEFAHFSFGIEENKMYNTSSSIRLSLWWLGLQSMKECNWFIGNGTGDVTQTMKITGEKYGITNTINSFDPHNQFIYSFLSLGFIGLIALLGCMLMPLIQHGTSLHFVYICFTGMIFITCFTESFFELQKGIVFFSVFNSLFAFQFQPVRALQLKLSHA
jgi:O-antigen ligase